MLLFLVVSTLILSLPVVQTSLASAITSRLNSKYQVSIHIERLKASLISWEVAVKGVYIQDEAMDTIFYSREIDTKLHDIKAIYGGDFNLGKVTINDFVLKDKTPEGSKTSNLDAFVKKLSTGAPSEKPFVLKASSLRLNNAKIRVVDENKNPKKEVNIHGITLEASPFEIVGSDVNAKIKNFSFNLLDRLKITKSSFDFRYSPEQMQLENLELNTSKSILKGGLVMDYQEGDFKDFYNQVLIHINLKDTKIATNDLNLFYPEFIPEEHFTTSAQIDGVLNNLSTVITYLNIQNTGIRGKFTFKNLFEETAPTMTVAEIRTIETSMKEIRQIMPKVIGVHLPDNLDRLGRINITGATTITAKDITANVNAETKLGSFYSNIDIQGIDRLVDAEYTGFLSLIDFNLGQYLFDNPSFSHTSMDANIQGRGFFKNSANTKAEGVIYSTTYNDYAYKDIEVSGLFQKQLFDGRLVVNDPHCKFVFEGLADFSNQPSKFKFNANIDHADFHQLHFVNDTLSQFKGKVAIDLEGTQIDDVVGVIDFKDTHYLNPDSNYHFDDFRIEAKQLDSLNRSLSINSKDIITGSIQGNFKMAEFSKLFRNSMGSVYTYYKPFKISKNQQFNFNFNIYNKLVEVFLPQLQFSPNTHIRGAMNADAGDFKMDFRSPSFKYYENKFEGVLLKVDTKNPLFKSYIEIDDAKTKWYSVKDFKLINNSIKDTLFFRTEFKGDSRYDDSYRLNFYHTFNDKDESVMGIKKSDMNFKGSDWVINPKNDKSNKLVLASRLDSLTIDRLVFRTNREEEVVLEGKMVDSTYKDLQIKFNRVSLRKITPDIDSLKLDGSVNGLLSFQQKDSVYYPSTRLSIADFSVNDFIFGDMDIDLLGNKDLSDFIVNAKIKEKDEEQLRLIGNVYHRDNHLESDLLASFNHFNLAPFSPLGADVVHRIRGSLYGNAKVTGDLKNPDITGELTISRGGIAFPYLNVDYDFDITEQLLLSEQSFDFTNLNLTDTRLGTKGVLKGKISHRSFNDWSLDLMVDTENAPMLLLDTKYTPESLYYGTGLFVGQGSIVGPTNNLNISIDGATAQGTSVKIPIEDAVSVGDYEFISFVEKSEVKNQTSETETQSYSGLDLAFNLEITPEAEVEIVIDPSTGSSLKGTGEGKIFMDINTSGKFNMFGDYVVSTGSYNYKFGGFIDKTFQVKSGGRINWEGDPLQAQLDLEAAYSLYANPAPLLENPGYTKRIPTDVIVRLNGALENPNIDFDIEFPGTNSVIKSELLYSLQDPTVQDRNAFFLLAQGTFVNDATGINQQAVTGNLLQSASGFLSSILDGSSDKFNFGLSYEQGYLDRDSNLQTDNKIGVSLSTKLSDRVLFNGRLGVPVGGGVSENVVAGDAELQILLNEEGSLSAKVFNRENEFQQFLLYRQGYTQGVGLSYRVDFNNLSQLVRNLMGNSAENE